MKEHDIMNLIRKCFSRGPIRLFRQNSGKGWTGNNIIRLDGDRVLIEGARPLAVGFKGLSDLGGWTTITVTPAMVGMKIAVYTAIEVKDAKGRVSAEQEEFIALVAAAGGLSGVARSPDDAARILGVDNPINASKVRPTGPGNPPRVDTGD